MDGKEIQAALTTWRHGHNPDGRQHPSDPELSPRLFARMMRGEISASEAHRLNREELKGRNAFNARIREQLGYMAGGELAADEVFNLEQGDGSRGGDAA